MKSSVSDLAVFGAEPAFKEKLHVGGPNIGDKNLFLHYVNDMLDRRRFTNNGPYVHELESKISDMLGIKHCIAVSNGTLGLQLAVQATEMKGEVIIPSLTFVATAHALTWQGLTPVFCDVNQSSHNRATHRSAHILPQNRWTSMQYHIFLHPGDNIQCLIHSRQYRAAV